MDNNRDVCEGDQIDDQYSKLFLYLYWSIASRYYYIAVYNGTATVYAYSFVQRMGPLTMSDKM